MIYTWTKIATYIGELRNYPLHLLMMTL